jgi:hypothetical protein
MSEAWERIGASIDAQVEGRTAEPVGLSVVVPDWADLVNVEAAHYGVTVKITWDIDTDGVDVTEKSVSATAETYQHAYESAIAQALAEMAAGGG